MAETEKERVYRHLDNTQRELEKVQHKCARQRHELTALRDTSPSKRAAIFKSEADNYRKALSNISYRLDNGGVDDETLRGIVDRALFLRGLKVRRREQIRALRSQPEGGEVP